MPDIDEFEGLKARVTEAVGTMASAKVLIAGQAQRIRDLADNATTLTQLKTDLLAEADRLNMEEDSLADAVAANPEA
jgi:hypothetical protein